MLIYVQYGLENLSYTCGDYCPAAGTGRCRGGQSGKKKARMGIKGRKKVLENAANFLSEARANAPALLSGDYVFLCG
jgi:hypothetical protein